MKIAIMASLFTKGDVNINTGHGTKVIVIKFIGPVAKNLNSMTATAFQNIIVTEIRDILIIRVILLNSYHGCF